MSRNVARTGLVAVALALTGCGGSTEDAAPPPGPLLPRAVANDLAARSDRVAERLASGDRCAADREADELRTRAVAVVSKVPPALQEELLSGVNALAERISCPAPPSSGGKGKSGEKDEKEKEKEKEKDGEDEREEDD